MRARSTLDVLDRERNHSGLPSGADWLNGYWRDGDICKVIGIGLGALKGRIATGTGHPPFIKPGKERLYPINAVKSWLAEQPLHWSVKDAKRR